MAFYLDSDGLALYDSLSKQYVKSQIPQLAKGADIVKSELLKQNSSFTVVVETSVDNHSITDKKTTYFLPKYIEGRTAEEWNADRSFIPEENQVIIYTDYRKIEDEDGLEYAIPGMKIGDGKAYLIDLPFVDDFLFTKLMSHINDRVVHITQAERDAWNGKVSTRVDEDNLIFY